MTDENGQKDRLDPTAQDNEPKVSKPYVMPDDPEEGSVEALAKELADAKDRTLRTLAEMENLRKRTEREPNQSHVHGDVLSSMFVEQMNFVRGGVNPLFNDH